MKKLKLLICSIIFTLAFAGFFPLTNVTNVNGLYSGEVINNVIYVTFKDGDNSWQNETPNNNYTNTITTIMDNSYNNSTSSVNSYYKTMSFNNLDLTSNFYFANSSKTQSFKVPYTKNELLTYSSTNTSGYLEYEVCTYTSSAEPEWLTAAYLTSTTHQFSCYDCENSSYSGTGYNCDLDTSDGIGCYCAYVKLKQTNSKTAIYTHLEEYIREQIALKTVLNQISSFSGNIDSNNDGYIDAMTFIFPHANGVDWSDLLWAHQFEIINFKDYLPSYLVSPQTILTLLSAHGVRNETQDNINVLLSEKKISNKACKSYNLYLFSDLVYQNKNALIGADSKEIAKVFTLAHELGHVLGLPDYYTYERETGEEDPVDIWDLMSYSYYSAPTYMTTYNRELLGFTNSNNIQSIENIGTYTLKPTCYDEINNNNNNSNNVLAYVLEDPSYPGQKIYLEYRYKGGKFEPNYPNKEDGLIIYRVDKNVKQIVDYSSMLGAGNFCSYPFDLYVFRSGNNFVLNDSNNSFGNLNKNSISNAITFQTYDTTKNQYELEKSDITFHNSGIVINNVSINALTNELTFTISGGFLKDPTDIDLSSIKLNGEENITHEVNTSYNDAGIDYGNFNSSEFNVQTQNNIQTNKIGDYSITYTITHISSNKQISLIRNVKIVDTTKPTLSLIGNSTVTLTNIKEYQESGVNYSDNYNFKNELQLTISDPIYSSQTGNYVVTYKVKDTSGNVSEINRIIIIEKFDKTKIKLIGNANIAVEVKNIYNDKGVSFGTYNENQFTINIVENVNENKLGNYTYIYNFIFKSTGEEFSLTRYIEVVDTTAPLIILTGNQNMEIYKSEFDNFTDPGYEFSDNYDYSLETNISYQNISNTEFVITYFAKDSSGNETEKQRFVKLIPKPINVTDNQININIKNNIKNIYLNNTITFEVDYKILNDNLLNNVPQIKFYINDIEILNGINGNMLTVKFINPGVYEIKAVIEDAVITKEIVVNDAVKAKASTKTATIVIIIISFIAVLVIAFIIISKTNENKIKQRLDKY